MESVYGCLRQREIFKLADVRNRNYPDCRTRTVTAPKLAVIYKYRTGLLRPLINAANVQAVSSAVLAHISD
jgi:hypothetical protein